MEINSGTSNPEGVEAVGEVLAERFRQLGFEIEWIELPDAMERGRPPGGAAGGRPADGIRCRRREPPLHVLLIGHLDTVFEPDDPFRDFVRDGDVAHGPGALDIKGGDVAILLALEGLEAAGRLDDLSVTVFFTGDEESPGRPLAISRKDLEAAARDADVALGFESGCCLDGVDKAVVARRSSIPWRLEVEGLRFHSSGIFSDEVGAGAAFELARILDGFYREVAAPEEGLTFNAGVLLAGTDVSYDWEAHRGEAFGKTNVVPQRAVAHGGLRALTPEQQERAERRMEDDRRRAPAEDRRHDHLRRGLSADAADRRQPPPAGALRRGQPGPGARSGRSLPAVRARRGRRLLRRALRRRPRRARAGRGRVPHAGGVGLPADDRRVGPARRAAPAAPGRRRAR